MILPATAPSPECGSIRKVVSFRSYAVDDDGLEYYTEEHIES